MSDINLHDVKSELVFDILTYHVTILTMPVANTEVPKIFNLGEVLNHEKVVLVRLVITVRGFSGFGQIRKLSNLVFDFANGLRLSRRLCNSRHAVGMSVGRVRRNLRYLLLFIFDSVSVSI